MKRLQFNQKVIIILIILSIVFFGLQLIMFNNLQESLFLFFQDLLFLPLQILFVTFILNKEIQSREKQERLEQINIVISAFFSDMGEEALCVFNTSIPDVKDISKLLDMGPERDNKRFESAAQSIQTYSFRADTDLYLLERMKTSLCPKKAYLLQMFSNPNLLEHNTFTNMLWALYHVIDELENRSDLHSLPETDLCHLSGDIIRAYGLLVYEWVFYMKHLKEKYPYLWSLAVRKNPFADNSVIVR